MIVASRVDAISALDAGYDLRAGVDELRLVWSPGLHLMRYRYTVNGRIAYESQNTARVFNLFLSGRTVDDIEVVSPRYRARRFRPNVWTEQPDPIPPEPTNVREYPRSKETVSDLLPEYRITLRELLTD